MIVTSLVSAPERAPELVRLNDTSWPPFLLHGDVRLRKGLGGVLTPGRPTRKHEFPFERSSATRNKDACHAGWGQPA
jgi:hypothetical protein